MNFQNLVDTYIFRIFFLHLSVKVYHFFPNDVERLFFFFPYFMVFVALLDIFLTFFTYLAWYFWELSTLYHVSVIWSFLFLNNCPLYWNIPFLFVSSPVDTIWIFSGFFLFWVVLLWIFTYKSLCGQMVLFLMHGYLAI